MTPLERILLAANEERMARPGKHLVEHHTGPRKGGGGNGMSHETRADIYKHLRAGLHHRDVAKLVGVHQTTVSRVARELS